EAVGNAIRHGNATSVDIAVLDSGVDLVGLVIADNGNGMAPDAAPGIGSDLFTSLAYDWSCDSSPQGTTVTADLTWSPAAIPQDSPHRRGRAAPQVTAAPANPGNPGRSGESAPGKHAS
ncbi:MAG: ATP-binding protein, partial [Actinobacteria bacterium]|nr:ATP-binding protein [Actinomycetota bacterium]